MLKLLVKKQLTEIFRAYIYDAKKNRARSKAATVGYIIFFVLLMVGVIGGMFTVLSLAMCRSMAEAGMSWFYFAIMGLMAILLGAFGSVFTTYSSLYLPKDNDQMLSLPIPVDTLIAARLLGVYLMGLMYSGVVVLPAPFDQVTNACSNDGDCAGVGVTFDVGKMLRDLTGISQIGDAPIQYPMSGLNSAGLMPSDLHPHSDKPACRR